MIRQGWIGIACLLALSLPAQGSARAAVPPCCPTESSYVAAVKAFADGDRAAALAAIESAPAGELKRAVSEFSGDDEPLLAAAAVMHLDLADRALATGDLPSLFMHIDDSAHAFLRIRRSDDRLTLIGTWYIVAAGLSMAGGNFASATYWVRSGLRANVLHGQMRLAEGIVDEGAGESDDHVEADVTVFGARRLNSDRSLRQLVAAQLSAAENAYREVIHVDSAPSDQEETRLRLGRVLTLEGKGGDARTMLEQVVTSGQRSGLVYLAHLFLADLATRQKDLGTAAREYQAALAVDPSSRIAWIGLSSLAEGSGDDRRAREDIRQWISHETASSPDPWRLYQMGILALTPKLDALVHMVSP